MRQSFLWRIDTPEHSDAMARFGDLLFTFINEGGMWGPREDRRPLTFRETESAAAELDAIAVYLEDIADSPNQSELEPREYPLCLAAVAWARQTREIAGTIRRTLGASAEDETEPAPTIETGLAEVAGDLQRASVRLGEIAEREWPPAEDQEEQETLISLAGNWQGKVESLTVEIAANVEEEPEAAPAGALGPEEAAAALRLLEKLRAALEEARNLQKLDREGVIGRSVGNLAESVTVLEAAIKGTGE